MSENADLESRYGRSSGRAKRDKRMFWVLGGVFAVILGAWVIWAGLDAAGPQIDARDIGYEIIDDNSINVTFEISVPTGTATACAVSSMNESFSVVGWKVIELPASDSFTRSVTELVRTSELANTGLIYRCWLT